jgi:hypothetical protein
MIDTYMDRASWPTWMDLLPRQPVNYDDPCYWNGNLYNTVIDRMAAEARYQLARFIATRCMEEKKAMARRVTTFTLDFGFQLSSFNLRIRKAYSQDWMMTCTDVQTESTSVRFELEPGLYVIEIRVPSFHWQTLTVDTRQTDFLKANLVSLSRPLSPTFAKPPACGMLEQ